MAGLHTSAKQIFPRNPTALCDIQNKKSERASDGVVYESQILLTDSICRDTIFDM